jgi:amino acid permease
MANFDPTTDPRSTRQLLSLPRFQFSLAWLLIAMTIIAVALGLAVTVGSLVSAVLFAVICCVLPTPLVICALFARGDVQASAFVFGIGLAVMATTCGALAVTTRRLIRRAGV